MNANLVARAAFAVLAACSGSAALADASLTLTPVSSACITTGSGLPPPPPDACSPWLTILAANSTSGSLSTVYELTYQFSYHDDGLAMPSPVTLDTADYVARGSDVFTRLPPPSVSFESATVAVDVTSTFGPNPRGRGFIISAVATDAPAGSTSFVD